MVVSQRHTEITQRATEKLLLCETLCSFVKLCVTA